MVEWFKAAVLKTAEGQLSEGSNPSFSAIFFCTKKKWRNEAVRLSLHGTQCRFMHRKMRFIFCGNAAKCFIKNA